MFTRELDADESDDQPLVMVNANDGIVTRLTWERERYQTAVGRANASHERALNLAHHIFAQRVSSILQDPAVQLPPLPPVFLELDS